MPVETATRISTLFANCRSAGKKAFIAYLTCGDPSPRDTASLVLALERGGAHLIELGVPFSDPIADGRVIQRASDRALRSGMTVPLVLEIVREIRRHSQIPLLLFSYLNPLLRYGFDKLARNAADAGVDGVLLTDLCVEEAGDPVRRLREQGLDTIFLAAPTSTERRLRLVAEHSSGFIYLVSRTGVTGEQASLSEAAAPLVKRMRALSNLPIAVGFGISTPEQVAEVTGLADAVVVGSAIVKLIEANTVSPNLRATLENFTRQLTAPLRA
ncbi:MAG: tryptophan synthase subunit alpha [Acidobacteriaceae bacterium]|nr:tryptophan synthase subunit alpha [Acidobacteriaceae bacterium]MBV9296623.1 tryptophan synthase subunit alpha [Acidobacteriaceae bacterium]MBV9765224.1 tryptophan synthase subunit alpha [Acidobacteriaceae bacterium]